MADSVWHKGILSLSFHNTRLSVKLGPYLPSGCLTLLILVFVLLHKADITQEKKKNRKDKKTNMVLSIECMRQYFQNLAIQSERKVPKLRTNV